MVYIAKTAGWLRTFWNSESLPIKVLCALLLWMSLCSRAADIPADEAQTAVKSLDFGVYWPPRDPSETGARANRPLLKGCISLQAEHLPDVGLVTHLRVNLSRPSDEAGREFWNSRLAFSDYDWMRYVRVWDADNRWLWPNLAYLLRLHGAERVERYGGIDPGKGVDNDFAAVLIRKYDLSGQAESEDTKRAPLVAAEWYPVGTTAADKHTLVHTAQSEEFTLHQGKTGQGLAGVWLIYADFMGAKVPDTWPQAPEFAGGILAYFELQWDLQAKAGDEIRIRHVLPKRSTDFDWEGWVLRTRAVRNSKSTAKLSDVAATETGKSKPTQSGKAEPR